MRGLPGRETAIRLREVKSKLKVLFGVLVVVASLFSILLSGPLFKFEPLPSNGIVSRVNEAADLDAYLANEEAKVANLKPDLAKAIVWATPEKKRTPLAIVYVHGFSASRGESSPVFEDLAKELGANLFFTRLTAHGLNDEGRSFATLRAQSLIDDAREALAIGRRLGERVILVGMSTGAALTLQLIAENRNASDIAAHVMISPNYCPVDERARLISGPLGPTLARVFVGTYREFEPENAAHKYFWTSRYRAEGIAAMMDVVNAVDRMDLSIIRVPTLTLYSKKDSVVSVPLIEKKHAEIGAGVKEIVDLPEARGHLVAGSAVAPEAIEPAERVIRRFLEKALH